MSLYIKSPKHAVRAFGLENPVLFNNYPLHRFEFAIRVNINPGSGKKFNDDLIMIVKSAQLPGVNFQYEETNEYNRSRIVYTKVQYGDSTIVMHDVADGKVLKFWKEYFEYYVADPRGFGFGLDTSFIQTNNRRYLIDSIDIFQFHAGLGSQTTLMFPRMVSFQPDTLNYEDVSGLAEISLTFKPEYVKYKTGNVTLPTSITDRLRDGASPDVIASSIRAVLPPPIDERDIREQVGFELANSQGRPLNSQIIQSTAESFGLNQQANVQLQPTSSSSLDIFGISSGLNVRTTPAPSSVSSVSSGPQVRAAFRSNAIGSVNRSNEQGGK